MKKIILGLIIISFIFISCGSPPPAPQPTKPEPVVEEPQPEVEPEPEPVVEEPRDVPVTEYIVLNGDTLSQIALKFYGTRQKAYYFPIIMAVNPGVIKHPDKLRPKTKLLVPDFELFMQHSRSKENAKPEFERCIQIYQSEGRYGVVESLKKRLKEF